MTIALLPVFLAIAATLYRSSAHYFLEQGVVRLHAAEPGAIGDLQKAVTLCTEMNYLQLQQSITALLDSIQINNRQS